MRAVRMAGRLVAMLACLWAAPSFAGTASARVGGWKLEREVSAPSYAWIEPESTNLNIDSVVLACEEAGDRQRPAAPDLPVDGGSVVAQGHCVAGSSRTIRAPRSRSTAVSFRSGSFSPMTMPCWPTRRSRRSPALSERLLDAMATGRIMVLRFDLLAERAGQPAAFDGEAAIALQAGRGGGGRLRRAALRGRRPSAWPAPGMTVAEAPAPFWTRGKDALCGRPALRHRRSRVPRRPRRASSNTAPTPMPPPSVRAWPARSCGDCSSRCP